MKTEAVLVLKNCRKTVNLNNFRFPKECILAWQQNLFTGKKNIKLTHLKINESFIQSSNKYF